MKAIGLALNAEQKSLSFRLNRMALDLFTVKIATWQKGRTELEDHQADNEKCFKATGLALNAVRKFQNFHSSQKTTARSFAETATFQNEIKTKVI